MRALTRAAVVVLLLFGGIAPDLAAAANEPLCSSGRGWSGNVLEIAADCGGTGGGGEGEGAAAGSPRPDYTCPPEEEFCRDPYTVSAPPEDEAPAPPAAPITISDLASFTPAVGELIVQPDGWGVLGVPTNFHATATDHVQDGTLLGQPIQVRWRPQTFTFDHGDGTTATTDDPGTLWTSTDDDWTETATSHEYEDRGQFTATLTVTFAADIAGAEGWVTVPGTLDVAAPAEQLRIFEVQTVLTRGNCIDYPDDPGCRP